MVPDGVQVVEVSFESLVNMDNNRLNKQVIWCDLKSNNSCRNWNFRVRKQFQKYNVQGISYKFKLHMFSYCR